MRSRFFDRELRLRWWVIALGATLQGCGALCGDEPLDAEERACVLDTIFVTARDDYPFFALKEIDWPAIRDDMVPAAMDAPDDYAFHVEAARFVAALEDGHSSVSFPGPKGDPVASIRIAEDVDGHILVTSVEPGSDAHSAGVLAGDEITAVDGEPMSERRARAISIIGASNDGFRSARFLQKYATHGPESLASLDLVSPDGERRAVQLARTREVELAASFSVLPGGYGYIRIPNFSDGELVQLFDEALDALRGAPGLVLDIRGNSGGSTDVAYPIAGRLFESEVEVFRFHKGSSFTRAFEPSGDFAYLGPIVLLVDAAVYSTSNMFAEGLAFARRAILVGRTTGGGTGIPEYEEQLTTQLSLRMSIYYRTRIDGAQTEVSGVTPHIEVPVTREAVEGGGFSSPGVPGSDRDLDVALAELDRRRS